jgi:L-seryl-tRNA(Ser) seleniumtransferase
MATIDTDVFKRIPAVSTVLEDSGVGDLVERFGRGMTTFALRGILDGVRQDVRAGRRTDAPAIDELCAKLESRLIRLTQPIGRRAINATGILLHTGLGRAPYCAETAEAIASCTGYSILQTSIETGKRCQRDTDIEAMLRDLTGCEAATVVNNNAAATMLILHTLAEGKEVIVSRGQLVEIGGSFRLPDVLESSGATLHEIGTTNRTHLRDYENAINENTGAIIHVHTSNYRIRGFSGTPSIEELTPLGKKHGIPVIDDIGSGALINLSRYDLPDEPLVRDSVAAGTDVICFSADKLICGPQGGIILGRAATLAKIRKNPFARMFRTDKTTLIGLQATLQHFVNGDYEEKIPLYRMFSRDLADLDRDAHEVAAALADAAGVEVSVEDDIAFIGSGSIPDEGLPSKVVRLSSARHGSKRITDELRKSIPSVFGRLQKDAVLLDMRTILPGELEVLKTSLAQALGGLEA